MLSKLLDLYYSIPPLTKHFYEDSKKLDSIIEEFQISAYLTDNENIPIRPTRDLLRSISLCMIRYVHHSSSLGNDSSIIKAQGGWESENIPNKHYDIKQVLNTECVKTLTKISLDDDGKAEIVCIYEEVKIDRKRPRSIEYDELFDLLNKHPCCSDALTLIQTHFEI